MHFVVDQINHNYLANGQNIQIEVIKTPLLIKSSINIIFFFCIFKTCNYYI